MKRATKLAKKARGTGLSVTKMANIQRNKMAKQGLLSRKNRKNNKKQRLAEKSKTYHQMLQMKRTQAENIKDALANIHPLSAEMSGEDFLDMLDEEELKTILEAADKRKLINTQEDVEPEGGVEQENGEVDEEDKNDDHEEQEYEQSGRSFHDGSSSKRRKLLPIKTDTDVIERSMEIQDEDDSDSGVHEESGDEFDSEIDEDALPEKSTVDLLVERRNKLQECKIKIGCLASSIIENPNEKVNSLGVLITMLNEPDDDIALTQQKYAALSLLELFHNLIPSYTVSNLESHVKLKKETKALYIFESKLLRQYKEYLLSLEKILEKFKKKPSNSLLQPIAQIALKCFGDLLIKHPHFNFTSNIIQAIVPYLNCRNDSLREDVFNNIRQVLKTDSAGGLSLEIIQKIDKLVRKCAFRVHEDALRVILFLRIKHIQNVDDNEQALHNAKQKKTRNEKIIKKLAEKHKLKPSRQQAKEKKKMAKLNVEIKMVLADKDIATRNQQDSGVIQIVFGLYIHVLKRRPNKKLIGTVLEGLAKFAHLVNIEFFSDLLEVLALLLDGGPDLGFTLTHRESLHCIQTVMTILSGQGEVLNIDPHRFCIYLFSKLLDISAANYHENILTTIESCNQLILGRKKKISPTIVNAFVKKLCTLSLTLLHNGAIPTLTAVRSYFMSHSCTEAILDTDPEGTSGSFNSNALDPLHSNASATSLWELHLLTRHYHSNVAQISQHLLKGAPIQGQNSLPFSFIKQSAEDLYQQFDSSEMKLKPSLNHPDNHLKMKRKPQKREKIAMKSDIDNWMSHDDVEYLETLDANKIDFYNNMVGVVKLPELLVESDEYDISNKLLKI